jgi:pimeloyl-ACP methyl ester carboxylesterase
MGFTQRWMLARALTRGGTNTFPHGRIATIWKQFDQGTQRAILRLHRATDPRHLATLTDLPPRPTVIVRGDRDPWLSTAQAQAIAQVVPGATVTEIADAGHWPWLDRSEAIDAVAAILAP